MAKFLMRDTYQVVYHVEADSEAEARLAAMLKPAYWGHNLYGESEELEFAGTEIVEALPEGYALPEFDDTPATATASPYGPTFQVGGRTCRTF